jgi:hypothetical protein
MRSKHNTIIRLALGALVAGTLATACGGGEDTSSPKGSSGQGSQTTTTVATGGGSAAGTLTVKELSVPQAAPVMGVDSEPEDVLAAKALSTWSAGPSNTVMSSNGAYLQSNGLCGGAQTYFDLTSEGFEWLQIGIAITGSPVVSWGTLTRAPAVLNQRYPLPIAFQNKIYVVVGWDWTGQGWENRVAITSFDRILAGQNNSTWFC